MTPDSPAIRRKAAATERNAGKPTRAERNDAVKRRLFEAGIKVVGESGYAEASVARITAAAGVAQGTFYTHYANRQELLDELLPRLGRRMAEFIRDQVAGARLVALESAHLSNVEQADAFTAAVLDFLSSPSGSA